eukprot:CAMPEP_0183726826 /NCGR_PEP_ID=MMETSP0737-20130205/24288_1 /TAXON_ID=385413 /ORGANISM="Thalassiosira miniscula, Strain CCMP1093" /LENGTH=394 /DNA_ID=CAMNT_0025958293 /DNA_START=25 /DNA_END=1206 /DNA_ORIENTATION=+
MRDNDDERLHQFARHCQAFYDSSLILHPSSSSLSSIQEEKKADEKPIEKKKKDADGKVVLETLHRISAIRSITVGTQQFPHTQEQNALHESTLRQEHALIVERHRDLLLDCGLLDMDRFIEPPPGANENKQSTLLEKYIQTRDVMRRRAHKISMAHRQNSFLEILSESENMDGDASHPSEPSMTRVANVQNSLSIIQNFVRKYQTNIGSHPFLAGLYRIVDMQLNPKSGSRRSSKHPSYIVRWKFRGSVLTEACRSCHNENDDDELAYAREAIQVLFSFLVWVKDVDVEGGGFIIPIDEDELELDQILFAPEKGGNSISKQREEPTLSFEVDKDISNANLRRILAVLPNLKRLDARATGSVQELDTSSSDPKMGGSIPHPRKNIDGHEDEQWPW